MFSREANASKVAFCQLVRQLTAWDFGLVDCQVYSSHLASLGAEEIPRRQFVRHLDILCDTDQHVPWSFAPDRLTERW
jgi:leucyl/phenylalanyl-tRNA--protein transferase